MSQVRDFLIELGIPSASEKHRHGRSGWVQINCPDCGEGLNKFHLGINERSMKANCWSCGPKNLPAVLQRCSDRSFREIQTALASILPASFSKGEERAVPTALTLPEGLGKLLPAHRRYLRERGFVPKTIRNIWKVQGIGISTPQLSWRLFIPVVLKGRMVSYTTRAIGNDPMRYVSCPKDEEIVEHKKTLYGIDYVTSTAIIHEGPLDVWATGPGAVATFGTSFTAAQLRRIGKLRKVVVCYDSSREAQQRAQALLNYLEPFNCECINVQLDAKDPAEALLYNPKELQLLRKLAFGKSR